MIEKIASHISDYLPYYLLSIYLVCMYFLYKGATGSKYKESVGDELEDLDDSENFYHNDKY